MSMANPVHLGHNWFMARRGGERTFSEIARLFPRAGVSTLFLDRRTLPPELAGRRFDVSPLGSLAPSIMSHRHLLPLYPWAVGCLRVPEGTRLLVTSDASLLKGIRKPPGCVHVCYCHSPPRYLWDMSEDYLQRTTGIGGPGKWLFRRLIPRLQAFDRASAAGVDHFIANSEFVAERIRRIYGREAVVLPPPVEVGRFTPIAQLGRYYLTVSELVSYKRVDLAVEACSRSGHKLIVVGDGPERARLQAMAGPSVEFRGRVADAMVAELLAGCRALLHPQLEDFGISAVEAQAAGRPVIAYRGGGALETVIEDVTGGFFDLQTSASLQDALARFDSERERFDSVACRKQAERFSTDVFKESILTYLRKVVPSGLIG
jgi:glycosyltransferase involved in cell wall biosynthesis